MDHDVHDGGATAFNIRLNWTMVGVVIALLAQSGALIAWGAKMDTRVAALEQKVTGALQLSDTVGRLDERTKATQETVDRIDQRLSSQEEAVAGRR